MDDEHGMEGPEISFDIQIEFYLKNRQDPIWTEFEVVAPVVVIQELGIPSFMELCLEDFMVEVNQRSSSFIVMRSSRGMRQVFWEDSIQGVTIHAPDPKLIDKLIEEAVSGR